MQKPFFSIVVVSLNPGERLEKTLNSILSQTYQNYEVILKDGGSKDGSLKTLQEQGFFEDKPQIRVIQKSDKSIYDGMNQAVSYVGGRYVQFLNCGDYFYSVTVLEEAAEFIRNNLQGEMENPEILSEEKSILGIEDKEPLVTRAISDIDSRIIEPYNETGIMDYVSKPEYETETFTDFANIPTNYVQYEPQTRDITIVLELDKVQLGKAVYKLNNEETQRVGVKLSGAYA